MGVYEHECLLHFYHIILDAKALQMIIVVWIVVFYISVETSFQTGPMLKSLEALSLNGIIFMISLNKKLKWYKFELWVPLVIS